MVSKGSRNIGIRVARKLMHGIEPASLFSVSGDKDDDACRRHADAYSCTRVYIYANTYANTQTWMHVYICAHNYI